mmetsp:Transcript_46771/g.119316  ORF Transcript_46771/g.119316 Transcript_46771/m.119316 type:complete len:204 (-) Transcript_46771:726-1337(-)
MSPSKTGEAERNSRGASPQPSGASVRSTRIHYRVAVSLGPWRCQARVPRPSCSGDCGGELRDGKRFRRGVALQHCGAYRVGHGSAWLPLALGGLRLACFRAGSPGSSQVGQQPRVRFRRADLRACRHGRPTFGSGMAPGAGVPLGRPHHRLRRRGPAPRGACARHGVGLPLGRRDMYSGCPGWKSRGCPVGAAGRPQCRQHDV